MVQIKGYFLNKSMLPSTRSGVFTSGRYGAKRLKALSAVYSSAEAKKALDKLPRILLISQPIHTFGMAIFVPSGIKQCLILPGTLELLPQKFVTFAVAHELAHIVLGHNLPGAVRSDNVRYKHKPEEKAANELALLWGFSKKGIAK